jgi:polysaccharide biosynthesis protein PslG
MRIVWSTSLGRAARIALIAAMTGLLAIVAPATHPILRPLSCAVPGGDIGVAGGAELMHLPDAALVRELDSMRAAGVHWLRVGVDWSTVEQVRGALDWRVPDRVVNFAIARGFRILGIILSTPTWARNSGAPSSYFALPSDIEEFGRFSGDAAEHFSRRIAFWEIWNEPNNADFAQPRPDVSTYHAMLSASARQIRARAKTPVQIVTGGLAPEPDDNENIAPTTFVENLYELGNNGSWDAVGVHPYTYPYLPDDPGTSSWNAFQRIDLVRLTMVDHGDASKRIWITEFGAPTAGPSERSVSEGAQAEAINQGVARIRSADYFGPLFIHEIRDRGTDMMNEEDHFGILRIDFSPKPAYYLVSRLTRVC